MRKAEGRKIDKPKGVKQEESNMKRQTLLPMRMNLQYFAEGDEGAQGDGGAAATTTPPAGGTDPGTSGGDGTETKITPEIQAIIDSAVSARANQLKKKHDATLSSLTEQMNADLDSKVKEALKKQNLSPEDAAAAELEEQRLALETRANELRNQELSIYAKGKLTELGIKDDNALSLLLAASEEDIDTNFSTLQGILNTAVKEQVKQALKSKTAPAAGGKGASSTKSMGAQIAEERNQQTKNDDRKAKLNSIWS